MYLGNEISIHEKSLVMKVTKFNVDTLRTQDTGLSDDDRCEKGSHVFYCGKGKDHIFRTGLLMKMCLKTAV
jgi:hypothetical protein